MPSSKSMFFGAPIAVGLFVSAIACAPARTPISPDAPTAAPPPAPESPAATSEPENWGNDGTRLFRTCEFDNEAAIRAFIEELNGVAADLKHDPDLMQEGTRLEIVTTTHDTGGLTDLDFALASEIDRLLAERDVRCQPQLLVGTASQTPDQDS